jgi:hypothetical protein
LTLTRAGLSLVVVTCLLADDAGAGQSYSRGQNVAPAYEGWEEDPDGTRYFLFGYLNRNWEEELDVPVGADNFFTPGEPDRGQPTHFLPRRNRFVFRVPVPAGFDDKDELVWTLTTHGKTEKAYATLRTDYFVDDLVKASEQGALGAGSSDAVVRSNEAPALTVEGDTHLTAKVGEPVLLVAVAFDDGIPEESSRTSTLRSGGTDSIAHPEWTPPWRITVGSATGLRLSWYVYRGAGSVSFDPLQTKVWEDTRDGANSPWANRWVTPPVPPGGRYETWVTFDEPGTYVLRCLASDGALGTTEDRTVTVAP